MVFLSEPAGTDCVVCARLSTTPFMLYPVFSLQWETENTRLPLFQHFPLTGSFQLQWQKRYPKSLIKNCNTCASNTSAVVRALTFCRCRFNLILKAHRNARASNVSEAKPNEIGQDLNNKAVNHQNYFIWKALAFPSFEDFKTNITVFLKDLL